MKRLIKFKLSPLQGKVPLMGSGEVKCLHNYRMLFRYFSEIRKIAMKKYNFVQGFGKETKWRKNIKNQSSKLDCLV